MNIALVILHADPARGGAERYTVDLAAALVDRGHDISLLASSFGPTITGMRQVKLAGSRGATRLGRYLRFLDALDSHLKSNSYDIIHAMLPVRHCNAYHPHAGLAAEAINSGHKKHSSFISQKLSQLANRFNRKRQRFAAVERKLLESPNPPMVLCLSEDMKQTVRDYFPHLPSDRLAKLFNATDLQRFDPSERPDAGIEVRQRCQFSSDHVVALMLSQDFQRKGLKEAIHSIARIADPRLRLLVAGKQDPSPYRRLAQSLGVVRQVCFAGATNDPYSFYRGADFLVLPTWHDPCSLVVLEALAMGVPVISTRYNGACEIMTDRVHGFILDEPSNEAALDQATKEMLNIHRRNEMSRACLALRNALSYENHLNCLHQLYIRIK